jgi:hypothetical protein
MRKTAAWQIMVVSTALLSGCSSHVLFVEHSHIGLKASFEPNQPTPAEVDLGWRRALFAMVPQKSPSARRAESSAVRDDAARSKVTISGDAGARTQIVVQDNPDELMSLYSVFRANIGFNDPVCVHHFLATGVAASVLLANEPDLRALARSLDEQDAKSPCRTRAAADGTGGGKAGDGEGDPR